MENADDNIVSVKTYIPQSNKDKLIEVGKKAGIFKMTDVLRIIVTQFLQNGTAISLKN